MMRNEEGECATMKSKKRKVDVDLENLVSEELNAVYPPNITWKDINRGSSIE